MRLLDHTMQRKAIIAGIIIILVALIFFFRGQTPVVPIDVSQTASSTALVVSVVATGLEIPWDLAFLPD